MYRIADLQIPGRYFADGETFETKQDVRDQLISYHLNDIDEGDEKILNKMTLEDVLAHGEWDIEEVSIE